MSALRIGALLFVVYIAVVAIVYFRQRSMLYFPSHGAGSHRLTPWIEGGQTIGYCREASNAGAIWLMIHGNAGQAADRDYVLARMAKDDSLYVLEYPGYGAREGSPSLESINQAAAGAYRILRASHSHTPICVLGESLGSGPACALARETIPPDKIVLVVPFDNLASVASEHFPFLPVRLMLHDAWDNVEALKRHTGPVEIFGAKDDTIIPIKHAQALAGKIPGARFVEISGGHNDWAESEEVKIRRRD